MITYFVIVQIDTHVFCVKFYMLKVIIMIFLQAKPNTTNLVDESAIGVNANVGNESIKHDTDPNVNEDFLVVSSSNPTDASKEGDGTGDTSVEMSDWEGDIIN